MIQFSQVRRILSLDPDPGASSYYGPIRFSADGQEYLIGQGGRADNGNASGKWEMAPFMTQERFADKLFISRLVDGVWSAPQLLIGRHSFPWMSDAAYLNANPKSFVSAVTSGNVIDLGDTLMMAASACVSDPNIGTEWSRIASPYGSRMDPWPYFRAFCFTCSKAALAAWQLGQDARNLFALVVNPYGRDTGDLTIDASFMGLTPGPDDLLPPAPFNTGFKGIGQGHGGAIHSDGRVYGTLVLWTKWRPKSMLWRWLPSRYPTAADSRLVYAPELWDGSAWIALDLISERGEIPRRLFDFADEWTGAVFERPARAIVRNPYPDGGKYIVPLLSAPPDGPTNGTVEWQATDNFTDWSPRQRFTLPFPFDGTVPGAVIDPFIAADGTLLFASTLGQDGKQLCQGDAYTGGVGIYEATLAGSERRRAATS